MLNEDKKRSVLAQIKAVLEGETDMIARMANAAALLHEGFGFWWTGFYRVMPAVKAGASTDLAGGEPTGSAPVGSEPADNDHTGSELVLGPFQGPVACQRIAFGRGVCGTAWKEARTIVVPDVDLFPGHIACSSESRSEVVVPLFGRTPSGRREMPGAQQEETAGRRETTEKAETAGRGEAAVFAVLDIDSRELATFDESDVPFLEEVAKIIANV